MQKITPFLWFDTKAAEAAAFYTSIFKNSKITKTSRMSTEFELDGQDFIAFNGGPHFTFTPAISLFVKCETQDEVDYFWNNLLEGGKPNQCGWLTDKFGVSWQVVPNILGQLLGDKDRAKSGRVMQAMMKMIKLDTNGLQQAYDQA
jgi:predicted 3-demethylubiquinone-9 3-methyltransferase (glyoxalase superfamily)